MRDAFTEKTKQVLQNRAGNHCSNPGCRVLTSGPNAHPEKATKTGVAAHITAASPGGPRYNRSLTPEQRKSALNGIWLCRKCANFIDTDYMNHPVSLLHSWKAEAEQEADDQNKGRKARLPIPPDNETEEQIEEGWGCPFCGTTVPFGKSVCLGCHAEVALGLTRYERQELAKTGFFIGGGLALILFVMFPNWLKTSFSWDIEIFFGFGLQGLILVAIPALLGSFILVSKFESKRLSEPPRFFRSTNV
jgi:ribosomal protein L37AE/L43A